VDKASNLEWHPYLPGQLFKEIDRLARLWVKEKTCQMDVFGQILPGNSNAVTCWLIRAALGVEVVLAIVTVFRKLTTSNCSLTKTRKFSDAKQRYSVSNSLYRHFISCPDEHLWKTKNLNSLPSPYIKTGQNWTAFSFKDASANIRVTRGVLWIYKTRLSNFVWLFETLSELAQRVGVRSSRNYK